MNQLTKSSTGAEIKDYFNAILKLSQASEEFPVNLDEVWPIVYAQKGKAMEALRSNFIEGVDFNLYQSGKVVTSDKLKNGIQYNAYLTVPCLEYFIARKVRPVFEVYRQIFHKTVKPKKAITPYMETKLKMAAAKWTMEVLNMNDAARLNLIRSVTDGLGLALPEYVEAKGTVFSGSELLKKSKPGMSIRDFNTRMIETGLMKIETRPSRKYDKVKKFKSLTESGLKYGENLVHPSNPSETQPKYYEDKFQELLNVLGI